ncbi:class I SAM-dependent methyltransferase [Fluoribacter dumoffii]|uniref:Trans-aconitate methyltransferase n=1 Tax=Fluoribacter dumoffii TaxID=463 RepID=A0A377G910_9GAMM|nr:class I SAM-dependent methyltransferase [Fluoribacter dumoffii]KTC89884.1 putative methyltransferase YrrT [Fluoribacter dumoffii NY 23]MCW8385181.1 class I SAM-dependent methyltransferase [Fluoribacter dumoffii]MCW8418235.1 class I SAM-dependent methyltransferase [Fluoribacter dumoffii]MCW8453923.1 class I SAM-dependent methyltransferase [Fluoribacter dumoffii]MCW8462006.1 class I SAM-dependent methyltransferase [Fluoribacter dumoffii]
MTKASEYFNENWQRYRNAVKNNTLFHREMGQALKKFLSTHLGNRPFSFVDVGCGDSSTVAPLLSETSIKKYIGIDAAPDVLKMAENTMASLHCEKEFIVDNMTSALPKLPATVDVIYTSYAVHHLSLQDKMSFIDTCKQKLNPNGFLLMVDGVLKQRQTREEWLDALESRMLESNPEITGEEIIARMEHPRADDHPEEIDTFAQIARRQSWKNFQVLVDKGIFAFMAFEK